MARKPRHLHRLLTLLDPLLGSPSLVVEPHHRPAVRFQVGHNEAHARKQLSKVELDFRHHAPRLLPTGRLVEKTLVPDYGLVAPASHRPRPTLAHVPRQG